MASFAPTVIDRTILDFQAQPSDEAGNFAYRWHLVLDRLDATDAAQLEQAIRENLLRD